MAILFNDILFGPIKSRRFGNSLGINLLPVNSKYCNFNCVYCECGWGTEPLTKNNLPQKEAIKDSLLNGFEKLKQQGITIDTITFAGNGEPTMHPDFNEIVTLVVHLKNRYFPSTPIAVLTNGTLLHKKEVQEALQKVEKRIIKLDAGTEKIFRLIDNPLSKNNLDWYVNNIKKINFQFTIQSMFLKGNINGKIIDNTSDSEIKHYIKLVKELNPKDVMLYTIDRTPASAEVHPVEKEKLEKIKMKLEKNGIKASIYV